MPIPTFKIPRIRRRILSQIIRKNQMKTASKVLSKMPVVRRFTIEDFLLPQMEINIQKDAWYLESMKVHQSIADFEDVKDDQFFLDDYSTSGMADEWGKADEVGQQYYLTYSYEVFNFKAWFNDGGYNTIDRYVPPTQGRSTRDSQDVYNAYESTDETLYFDFVGDPLYDSPDTISEQGFLKWIRKLGTQTLDTKILESNINFYPISEKTVESGVKGVIATPSIKVLYAGGSNVFINLDIEWTFFKPNPEVVK